MKAFRHRKEELFNVLLKAVIVLGAIAYVPSMIACLYERLYLLAAIDTLGYLLLLSVYLLPGVNYSVRLYSTVFVALIIGAAVLIETGPYGAGHIWLVCAVFIAAMFSRPGIIVTSIVFTQIIMIVYAVLNTAQMLRHEIPTVSILAVSANMLLISVTMSLVTYFLLQSLQKEITSQGHLMRLLHHRIKNNLQAFESLIALSVEDIDVKSSLHHRVRAISAANSLLLDAPQTGRIDCAELLRMLTDPAAVYIESLGKLFISTERLNEAAVGLSDLIETIKDQSPLHFIIDREVRIQGQGSFSESISRLKQLNHSLLPPEWLRYEEGRIILKIPQH